MSPVESEAKLTAPVDFSLPVLDGTAGMRAVDADDRVLDAIYFDTPDYRLFGTGATLRHRTGEGPATGRWTLKLPKGATRSGALRRDELDFDAARDARPSVLDATVDEFAGDGCAEQLRVIAMVRTQRHIIEMRTADGTPAAEIDVDDVRVADPTGAEAGSFRELEVELRPAGDDALIVAVVDRLRAAGAGAMDQTPKVVRALDLLGVVVKAAGTVVWRAANSGIEVLVVHRPKYDDWSLPKGKLEPGETEEECAVRETHEETGYLVALGAELPGASYVDRKRRPKTVRYWEATVDGGEFVPCAEVDDARWLAPRHAAERLSYPRDAEVVAALAAIRS
jgi:8-oxo-dGTP diphosphatase